MPGVYDKVSTNDIVSELFDMTSDVDGHINDIIYKSKYAENAEMCFVMLLFKNVYELSDILSILSLKYATDAPLQLLLMEVITDMYTEGLRFVREMY